MDDDRQEPVTRLGPDSGGRMPGDPAVARLSLGVGPGRRPTGPGCRGSASSCSSSAASCCSSSSSRSSRRSARSLVLAIGLAFLVKWAIDRGTGSLYAGAIITALAVPGLLNAAGVEADGLSTFSFGVAFLFIALVRAASGGGVGWQFWFGGLLALVGGVEHRGRVVRRTAAADRARSRSARSCSCAGSAAGARREAGPAPASVSRPSRRSMASSRSRLSVFIAGSPPRPNRSWSRTYSRVQCVVDAAVRRDRIEGLVAQVGHRVGGVLDRGVAAGRRRRRRPRRTSPRRAPASAVTRRPATSGR